MSIYIPIGLVFWACAVTLILTLNHYGHTHTMCRAGHIHHVKTACKRCPAPTEPPVDSWTAPTLHGGVVYDHEQVRREELAQQVEDELRGRWTSSQYAKASEQHCGRTQVHPMHLWMQQRVLVKCAGTHLDVTA